MGGAWPAPGEAQAWLPAGETWRSAVVARAERLLANRHSLFDLKDWDLGEGIDWNYEYKAGKRAPLSFAPAIDYRDYAVTGDCKFVWELNRHHHLVVLGRAYRVTGDEHYARAAWGHMESWMRQCPFGRGMNWRSPLELGIRLINWVWALELIRPSGLVTPEREQRLLAVVYRHLWDISRKYSRFSSANNHLIGEAAGVFIGSSTFGGLRRAPGWRERSRTILEEQIAAQTYPDGGNREQAMGYHLFTLELFLLAGLVARNVGQEMSRAYWEHLERMFEYVSAFMEGGDAIPVFGDGDDGYVLDLGAGPGRVQELMAVGAALFGRGDFARCSGGYSEPAYWLLGRQGFDRYEAVRGAAGPDVIGPRAFPHTGRYLLQYGRWGSAERISVSFDCGELGYGSMAAHGHADALSLTLRAYGLDVLVDPGTYDYFTYPRWREYFRSTAAHNAIVVDGEDQAERLAPFLWGHRGEARCLRWEPAAEGGTVVGEHDGYGRLRDPVAHRRTIRLDGRRGEVRVLDELIGGGRHDAALHLHFAEHCQVEPGGGQAFAVRCGPGEVRVVMDPQLSVSVFRGSEDPILGWMSRAYHHKARATTLVGRCEWAGRLVVETRLEVGKPAGLMPSAARADSGALCTGADNPSP